MNGLDTVLVVRHNGLGDLVVARPAIAALRRRFPRSRFAVTCPSHLIELAARLGMGDYWISERQSADPVDHEVLDRSILPTVAAVSGPIAAAVVLRVPDPTVLQTILALQPRLLCSFSHPEVPETAQFPHLDWDEHIVVRWGRIAAMAGATICDRDLHVTHGFEAVVGATIVHPGAGSPARQWPLDRWVTVMRGLIDRGHRVLVTGTTSERPLVAELLRQIGLTQDHNRAGTTTALELAKLVAGATLVVSTDTGVAHLAFAFGRPSVTLFGAVSPHQWGPGPGAASQHKTLWAGRHGPAYAAVPDSGLLAITPVQVLDAVDA